MKPFAKLRRWQVFTLAGHIFVSLFAFGSSLGGAFGLAPLIGIPAAGVLGFTFLVLFRRSVRRAGADDADVFDEARLLGFVVPAVVPLFRPLVELGLLQSAARIAGKHRDDGGHQASLVVVTWLRAIADSVTWIAVVNHREAVACFTATASLVLLGSALHLVVAPILEARRPAPPEGTAADQIPVAVVAIEGIAG